MSEHLIAATKLKLGYRNTPVISDVTFSMERGEVLCVIGHNGSGKSTLVKTLLGILRPLAGTIDWPNSKPERTAFLGQRTDFDNRFPMRVRDLAAMGSWSGLALVKRVDKVLQRKIDSSLERTGISQIADMPLYKLSAGQLQRALFARTIVQDASLILLDEPFTAIDQTTEAELLNLINEWSQEGRSIILVLHDLSAVLQLCDSVLLLGNGRSLFGDPRLVLTPDSLIHAGYLSSGKADWLETMHAAKASA